MLFISNVQRLRNHWISHNVECNSGVSEDSLVAFEDRYGVTLPTDLRDYFLTVNGMLDGVTDQDLIRFWTLEEVTPLPSGAPEYASQEYVDNPESLFLFADYSLWAHAYAIRLVSSPPNKNEILIIGGDYPIRLFQSFSDLLDSYLTDKALMFPQSSIR